MTAVRRCGFCRGRGSSSSACLIGHPRACTRWLTTLGFRPRYRAASVTLANNLVPRFVETRSFRLLAIHQPHEEIPLQRVLDLCPVIKSNCGRRAIPPSRFSAGGRWCVRLSKQACLVIFVDDRCLNPRQFPGIFSERKNRHQQASLALPF